jgi:hypothetical protein
VGIGALGTVFWPFREHPKTGRTIPSTAPSSTRLDALTVARDRGAASYRREAFGTGGHPRLADGCTPADDVLRRDLAEREMAGECTVLSGELDDPYTGARLRYSRGGGSEIEIDHVVPLGDAWRSGAWSWPPARRVAFADDTGDLLAVAKSANQAKGSLAPDRWRPIRAFWCPYATRWIAVKERYTLSVTKSEKAALSEMLADCPGHLPMMCHPFSLPPAKPWPGPRTTPLPEPSSHITASPACAQAADGTPAPRPCLAGPRDEAPARAVPDAPGRRSRPGRARQQALPLFMQETARCMSAWLITSSKSPWSVTGLWSSWGKESREMERAWLRATA